MEYNLKITFGGKSHFAFIEKNGNNEVSSKEKLVKSSVFNDLTEYADELDEDDLETWTTNIYYLFKDTMSVRIEYIEPIKLPFLN